MTMLHTKFKAAHQFCIKHNEQMIQTAGGIKCKSCCVEHVLNDRKNNQSEVDQMVREKHFAGAMIPKRHSECGFLNYEVNNSGQEIAKSACRDYSKNMIDGGNGNLILVGRTGTGKTHLACAVARNVLSKKKYARYITSEVMASEIANAWTKPDDSEASAIYRFTEYDLLILDEYGLHDQHEKRLELVHKVLYSRYDAGKPTMLISNFSVQKLKENLGDRLWSRFQHDGLKIIECNWSDMRVNS